LAVRTPSNKDGSEAVVHLSRFHCAVMSTGGRLNDSLRELYGRQGGSITDTLAAFDKLQAILTQERSFAQDVAMVSGMMAAEGKLPNR
jgi:hypothetical protein